MKTTKKKTTKRGIKAGGPNVVEVYEAIVATRGASLFGERWEEAEELIAPMALGQALGEVLKQYGLEDHPECRDLYEAIAQHNHHQAELSESKRAAIKAIKQEAMKAHQISHQAVA